MHDSTKPHVLDISNHYDLWVFCYEDSHEFIFYLDTEVVEWLEYNNIQYAYGPGTVTIAFETFEDMGLFILRWF